MISKEGKCQFGPPPGWFNQTSSVSEILMSVNFVNNTTGWIVGYNGVILKTTNGGLNWNNQVSGTLNILKQCSFVSTQIGFVLGNSSLILKTTNGGANWFQQISGTTNDLTSTSIVNDSIGYICGLNQTLLKTTNGGNNWNSLSFPDSLNFHSIFFNNSLTGWLSSENPEISSEDSALKIFKTTNGGNVWFEQFNYPRKYSPFLQLQFSDSLNGWTVINYNAIDFTFIFRTTNGGNSWIEYPLGPNGGYSFYFINARKGWAAGSWNRLYNTLDGGVTWNRPNLLPSTSYTSIFFTDSLTGWTVGDHGTILKTTTGGVLTNFTNTSTEIPGNYYLSQNYPNPFNPVTVISYTIPSNVKRETSNVRILIYDNLGKEITSLVNENKPVGRYEVTFNARNARQGSDLPSGIYFYSLLIDGNTMDTKRMVLLK